MNPDEVMQEAERVFTAGDWAGADRVLTNQWSDTAKAPPRALHLLGAIRFRQRNFADSERFFRRALKAEPGNAFRHLALGDLLVRAGQPKQALDCIAEALRLDPNLEGARRVHAHAAFTAGRFVESEESARAMIAAAPSVDGWDTLSCALREQGKADEALAAADEALKLDPTSDPAQNSRGAALARLGRDKEALDIFNALVTRGVEAPAVWLNRGTALYNLSRLEEAEKVFADGARRWPEHTALQNALAAARKKLGKK